MLKRNQIITISIVFLLAAGVGIWLLFFKTYSGDKHPLSKALPSNFITAWQGNNFIKTYTEAQQTQVFKLLRNNTAVNDFAKEIKYFDSLLSSNENIRTNFLSEPMLVSMQMASAGQPSLLFVFRPNETLKEKGMQKVLLELAPKLEFHQRIFRGKKIFDASLSNRSVSFSFSMLDDLVAISKHTLLVEDAIEAYIGGNKSISRLTEEMAKDENKSKIYVNYNRFPDLLNYYVSPQASQILSTTRDLANTGSYDLKITEKSWMLSGILQGGNSYISSILSQTPATPELAAVLPASTAVLMNWSTPDFPKFHENYLAWQKQKGLLDVYNKAKLDMEAEQQFNLDKDFIQQLNGQWGYAATEPLDDEAPVPEILIFQPKDAGKMVARMNEIHASLASDTGGTKFYRNYKIYPTKFRGTMELLFGDLFSRFSNPYFTQVDDKILFSDSAETLKRCVDAFLDNQTLANASAYKQFIIGLSSQSNLMCYINPQRAFAIGNHLTSLDFAEQFETNQPIYKGFSSVGFQLSSTGQTFIHQIVFNLENGTQSNQPEALWSYSLEAPMVGKPYVFYNDKTLEKRILCSDQNHQVYMLSSGGRLLWKRKLDEAIIGDVYQVDLYKNRTFQYLFATSTQLMLLDKDGNDAANYPLRLGQPATSGIALFDASGEKDYKYFIGTKQGRIYGYYLNGKPIAGCDPLKISGDLTLPMKSLTIKSKTYFFGVSNTGTVYFLNSEGSRVLKPIEAKTSFHNPLMVRYASTLNDCDFLGVDTSGKFTTIHLDGRAVERRKLRGVRGNSFLLKEDLDGNDRKENIFTTPLQIKGVEIDTVSRWHFGLSTEVSFLPQIIKFGNSYWVGWVDATNEQVFLQDIKGKIYPDFPLKGSTDFVISDLNNNGEADLICGGSGNVVLAYRIRTQ